MIAAPDAKPLIAANAAASDSGRISSRRRSVGRTKYATAAINGSRDVNMVPSARIPIRPSRSQHQRHPLPSGLAPSRCPYQLTTQQPAARDRCHARA